MSRKQSPPPPSPKLQVAILMGSRSDLGVMKHAAQTLKDLGVGFEVKVISAHRAPAALTAYLDQAEARGIEVVIAAAGCAAHLPGVTAAQCTLPVLGVPMYSDALSGMDALFAIAQMPGGVPVGTLALGKAGAVNAALLAASILGLKDARLRKAYTNFRKKQTTQAQAASTVTEEELGLA